MSLDALRSSLAVVVILAGALASTGCAKSDVIDPGAVDPGGSGDGDEDGEDDDGDKDPQDDEEQVCLLHNCTEDAHCGGCSEGRTACLVEEKRCVACSAGVSGGCPEGESCSSWGNCVPDGLSCETDPTGTPTITCATSADCAACDPMHQVCDGGSCVACTANDTSSCQATDECVNNVCAPKCPSTCDTDNDCGSCGTAGNEAHACNAHKCAECSPTYACPAGSVCTLTGTCEKQCGTDGGGRCESDADCTGCGVDVDTCHHPINGGAGTCGPSAAGCSDLGDGVVVLPAPFDQVTNLCSDDADCGGVGVTFNVGDLLRDLTGIDDIGDANIEYPMSVCAGLQVSDSLSCGVCVPCRVDADCMDIDIDGVALDAFGPLGSLAAALLLHQVFGPNDHKIHMYCEGVAGDYGVCSPCPGFIYDCGVGGDGGSSSSGSGGGGSCDHEVCEAGGPLNLSCDSCSQTVCEADDFCCTTEWDSQCVSEADAWCDGICSGGSSSSSGGTTSSSSGGGGNCHDECSIGEAMDATCNDCVDAICQEDSYCCDTEWDSTCVGYVDQFCDPGC